MIVISDRVEGDLRVNEHVQVNGMIVGTTVVTDGGRLVLNGMVIGDVIVEAGGTAKLNGMVIGTVHNRGGSIDVFGIVEALQDDVAAAATFVDPNAVVRTRISV